MQVILSLALAPITPAILWETKILHIGQHYDGSQNQILNLIRCHQNEQFIQNWFDYQAEITACYDLVCLVAHLSQSFENVEKLWNFSTLSILLFSFSCSGLRLSIITVKTMMHCNIHDIYQQVLTNLKSKNFSVILWISLLLSFR